MTFTGRVIAGRYRLLSEIGSGGMGRVWEGYDEQLDRRVALKELSIPIVSTEDRETLVARALREGRTAAALADHPNVVPVYDVVLEDEVPWIVMQRVRGRSLREVLLTGPLTPDQVARIAEAMLAALAAADAAGVTHRDVKPANIILADDGRVLLTDFGIAKRSGDSGLTITGVFVGTVEYTAPERVDGHAAGLASDLFSLGVTLYEAVEGSSPFHRSSPTGSLTAIVFEPMPPFHRASANLRALIEALTRKAPADRPDIAQARALLSGGRTSVTPYPHETAAVVIGPPDPRAAARRRTLMVVSAVCAVLLVAGAIAAIALAMGDSGTTASPPPATRSSATATSVTTSTTSAPTRTSSTSSAPPSTSAATSPSSSASTPPPSPPAPVSGALGTVTNVQSGLCIDTNGPQAPDVALQVRTCGNFTGQTWTYDATTGSLRNPPSGYCVDTGGPPAVGVAILLRTCGNYTGQQWTYDRTFGHFINLTSGLCMDTASAPANYVNLVLKQCGNGAGQKWRM